MSEIRRALGILEAKELVDRLQSDLVMAQAELQRRTKYNEASVCGSPADAEVVMYGEIEWAKTFAAGYRARENEAVES